MIALRTRMIHTLRYISILYLHDLPPLSLKLRLLARPGSPFVIRGIPIQ